MVLTYLLMYHQVEKELVFAGKWFLQKGIPRKVPLKKGIWKGIPFFQELGSNSPGFLELESKKKEYKKERTT